MTRSSLKKKIGWVILVYIVLLAVLVGSLLLIGPQNTRSISTYEGALQDQEQQLTPIEIPEWSPRTGSTSPTITIVEFADFQCPFCKAAYPTIRRVVQQYPQVQLVYRHFPIESLHPEAKDLAHASMCAHEQGKFWAFHDRLYTYQGQVTMENVGQHAQAVGLILPQFDLCMQSDRWDDRIEQDLADALRAGSQGTPAWLVNGQLVHGPLPFSTWEQLIDSLQ